MLDGNNIYIQCRMYKNIFRSSLAVPPWGVAQEDPKKEGHGLPHTPFAAGDGQSLILFVEPLGSRGNLRVIAPEAFGRVEPDALLRSRKGQLSLFCIVVHSVAPSTSSPCSDASQNRRFMSSGSWPLSCVFRTGATGDGDTRSVFLRFEGLPSPAPLAAGCKRNSRRGRPVVERVSHS